jgi:hypothetical protein
VTFEANTDTGSAAELHAQGETLLAKLFADIAPIVWEHISFNGGYVWPSKRTNRASAL